MRTSLMHTGTWMTAAALSCLLVACGDDDVETQGSPLLPEAGPDQPDAGETDAGPAPGQTGQDVFRFDTYGNEQFWTDMLALNEAIQESVSPEIALSVGLKVDATVLPEGILDEVDLSDPATTVALLELGAVVGVQGTVEDGELVSVGITCALCHSTVDDSVIPGIGERLDGHANRDLNPGAIVALSPVITDAQREMFESWGAGFYDPYWNTRDTDVDNTEPVVIPPIYGLAGVSLETYTGEGPISYWNNYVAVTQMGGQGDFQNEDLGIDMDVDDDLVAPKLAPLLEYQLSLTPPEPPEDSFDPDAAELGQELFEGAAQCSGCHSGDALSDDDELHMPEETGMDPTYATQRGTTNMYRTTPLRALFDHAPYFHDGSAATLQDVVEHYNAQLELDLSEDEQASLVEYLKSL